MSSYGLLADFRCPKVSKGERREAGIQWIQPPKAVSDPEFRQTTSGAHGSANRADCLPRGKPFSAPAGAYLLTRGADAPTTARTVGLPPRGGPVLSFEAKESTKESQRHGNSCGPPRYASRASVCGSPFGAVLDLGSLRSPFREKGSYCPFCRRGSQRRAQTSWIAISYCRARSCSLFSSFKKGKAFSLRCLSPLCSPTVGVGQTQPMRIGMFWRGLGGFAAQNSRLGFCSTVGINNHAQTTQLGCFDAVWIFSQHKRPAGFHIHTGLYCEP